MQETRSQLTSSGNPVRHPSDTPETARKPKPLLCSQEALLFRPYSRRIEEEYCRWLKWFIHLDDVPTRQSFATHLLHNAYGYDKRTFQMPLDHKEVSTRQSGLPVYIEPDMVS